MASLGKIARRTFLVGLATVAGGAVFGAWWLRQPWDNPLTADAAKGEGIFTPFVQISADNTITVYAPRAEMGQGITTTLPALVAEELDVDLDQVTVEHGPASGAYGNAALMGDGGPFAEFDDSTMATVVRSIGAFVGPALGLQVTGGSTSVRDAFVKMREAGAAARHVLVEAASRRFGVPAGELATARAVVSHAGTGRSATYGELAADAAKLTLPGSLTLKSREQWRLLGKPQPRTDMLPKVTGAPIFGIDVDLPDMLHATVRMNPRLGGAVVSADLSKAQAAPGVVKVVPLETRTGNGFGVIATSTWAAFKAAELIEVQWGEAPHPASSAEISTILADAARTGSGSSLRDDGDVDTAFADAPRESLVEAEYSVPYLAHATMEPMNATAQFKDGRLTLWCGNQAPTILATVCAGIAGIETADVTVNTTYMGGGFGRRAEVDAPIYATLLAMAADGRPVKVTWTREEDTTHDVYRPAAHGAFRARLGPDGLPEAVEMRIAAPSVVRSVMGRTFPSLSPAGPEKQMTEGAFDQPYAIANYRVTGVNAPVSIPVGFWRSVGYSFNGFFHECFVDEIAAKAGIDPVDMRLRLMADRPVAANAVRRVADMSGWSTPAGEGRARGIAFTLSFGGWVAEVAQVAQTDDGIRIEQVWAAADIGLALDPEIVRAQVVSGIVYGLSAAVGQEITFAEGMVEQANFDTFDAMRIDRCPRIEVEVLETAPRIGGVGEIGTPPAAPALANAIFALTGKRIRSLPLSREVTFA